VTPAEGSRRQKKAVGRFSTACACAWDEPTLALSVNHSKKIRENLSKIVERRFQW
jgi:hypothetical protein